ncbi:MAG TPA: hypothetical protein VKP60_20655 [Magnetospirillaceae bacterium]|nr:hypothetical protein [Magnetospirillaceae bacterium]
MKPKSTSFEVQVLKDQRWVLSQVVLDENEAIQFADNLLSKSSYTAVRVVRDFARQDGLHSETVLVEKTKTLDKKEVSTATVSDAPICTELADAYGLSSRMTIGRVFRAYLDEALITPTELLHHAREMKRLGDKGTLLMNAVDQISALQAPGGGEESKARRDFLHRSWDQLYDRARKAASEKVAKALTFAEIMARAGKTSEDKLYQARVLMAEQLLEQRGWAGKLDKVLRWAAEEGAEAHLPLLDGIVADLLIPAETIQDLLGFQPNLSSALIRMCNLAEGKAESADQASETFATLNRLLAAGKLPETQEVLFNRVYRELKSVNPLSRNEPSQEFEAFLRVLNRLITTGGMTGGPLMAEALTHRFVRNQSVGGQAGLQNAIDDLAADLGRCRGIVYLMSVVQAPRIAEKFKDHILRKLGYYVDDAGVDEWVPAKLSPPERMSALTACHRAISLDKNLPEKLRTDLANAADTVLVAYLEHSGVIEKIDKPEDPLAFRALRLVKFCGSGVLIKGKSLALAQKRVLGHLRQPNFEEKFLSSIPDKGQAEKHLREFHKLLVESGFKF